MGRMSTSSISALTSTAMIQSAARAPGGSAARTRIPAHLRLVGQRGLVPMVPVGDVQPLARQERQQPVVRLDLGRGVQQAVDVSGAPLAGPRAAHDVAIPLAAIEVDGQDRRELGPRRTQQGQPIRLGAGHGVLMPSHIGPVRLEQHPGQDALHGRVVRHGGGGVRVVVDRCVRASLDGAVRHPRCQRGGRRRVRILARRQLQADRVYRNWFDGPDDTMARFVGRSVGILEEMADASGNIFELARPGYAFATADPAMLERLRAQARRLESFGAGRVREHPGPVAYTPSNGAEWRGIPDGADILVGQPLVREHFPFVDESAIAVSHVRRAGWMDALRLGRWMLDEALRNGARILRDEVIGVDARGGRLRSVRLASGTTWRRRGSRSPLAPGSPRCSGCWIWTCRYSSSYTRRCASTITSAWWLALPRSRSGLTRSRTSAGV